MSTPPSSPFKGLNKLRDTTRTLERLDIALKRASAARRDGDKKKRRARRECRYCYFYAHGVAGQAFTEYVCDCCQQSTWHPNTSVPRFCDACCDEHKICCRCGADVELKLPLPEGMKRK